MDTAEILQAAEVLLQPWAKATSRPGGTRLDVNLAASDLLAAVGALHGAHLGYLVAISGMDHPAPTGDEAGEGTLEVLYHFAQDAAVITLRVTVSYEQAVVPTVCNIIPSATLYERELMELFGIEVRGTPTADRLVLAEDWPEGVYPLRKSFKGLPSAGDK